jgi:hypothetical protein
MFRKTIAVLLMFSIVLSSCGKKDKSNDFVRVCPVETSASVVTPAPVVTSAGFFYSFFASMESHPFVTTFVGSFFAIALAVGVALAPCGDCFDNSDFVVG